MKKTKNPKTRTVVYHYETYSEDSNLERQIKSVLISILKQFECEILVMPIFTCLSELLGNAIRANYKNIYFENYCQKKDSIEVIPYNVALQLFKMEFASYSSNLHSIALEKEIKATIKMYIETTVLHIEVLNPMPLSEIEKNNIKRKIEDSKKFSSLNDYYKEIVDDSGKEGAGLGIVFVIMMLRSLGLSEDSLKFNFKNGNTEAKISIPLTKQTVDSFSKSLR